METVLGAAVLTVIALAIYFRCCRSSEKKQAAARHEKEKADFLKRCREYGIAGPADLESPEKAQRLERLAAACHMDDLSREALLELIAADNAARAAAEEERRRAEMDQLRAEEQADFERLQGYAALHGTEKPVTMLRDIAAALRGEVQGARYIGTKRESDGAVMAGVAAGIGGVVPAAMSFSNTERVNQDIRRHNEMAGAINAVTTQVVGRAYARASEYKAEAGRMKCKLVGTQPAGELFERLEFRDVRAAVSPTGTVRVQALAAADPGLVIFDHLPAFIDGSVRAAVRDGEETIGEAVLVFPALGSMSYGLDERVASDGVVDILGIKRDLSRPVQLEGLLLFRGEPGKSYTVSLSPGDLWAMEQ